MIRGIIRGQQRLGGGAIGTVNEANFSLSVPGLSDSVLPVTLLQAATPNGYTYYCIIATSKVYYVITTEAEVDAPDAATADVLSFIQALAFSDFASQDIASRGLSDMMRDYVALREFAGGTLGLQWMVVDYRTSEVLDTAAAVDPTLDTLIVPGDQIATLVNAYWNNATEETRARIREIISATDTSLGRDIMVSGDDESGQILVQCVADDGALDASHCFGSGYDRRRRHGNRLRFLCAMVAHAGLSSRVRSGSGRAGLRVRRSSPRATWRAPRR